ncbi:hypothetical protein LOTGIDRAFT_172597 [Lottia gigantea]|uniref:Uncharacterized protein n=1 Tax=Lottia gigantea TaxID=225164 RepID=V4AC36_LOTGI|nr:hypothetical protein LOTGIDRAFT_172597 [Lottia gigantea]ESP01564.1 hypothetical protein LOTGIDRAFT_172597 [Lottia gigantea]
MSQSYEETVKSYDKQAFDRPRKRKRHRKKKSSHRVLRKDRVVANSCIFDLENCEICVQNNYFNKLFQSRQNCRRVSDDGSDIINSNIKIQYRTSKIRKKRTKEKQNSHNSDNFGPEVLQLGSNVCTETGVISKSQKVRTKTSNSENENWKGKSRSWRKRHRKDIYVDNLEMKYAATMGVFRLWNMVIEKDMKLHSQRINLQKKDSKILQLSKIQIFNENKIHNLQKSEYDLTERLKEKEGKMNELRRDYEYIQGLLEENHGLTINRECLDDIQAYILESVTMINSLTNMIQSREI